MTSAPVILDASGRPAARSAVPDVRARYEAAFFSTARSVLPTVIRSAREDLSGATRRRLLALSRYLKKNNPLVSAVVERLVTYTVGTGIIPEPESSDPKWNDKAARVWEAWARRASLNTRQTFGQLQRIMLRAALVDGDCFLLKTYGTSGRPRVQLIESHEIGDPDNAGADDRADGVIFDDIMRPRAYLMPAGGGIDPATGIAKPREIAADEIEILANIERANQHRGPTLFASAITTAQDLHEILALEKAGVKTAGAIENIVKTATGEVDVDELLRSGTAATTDDATRQRYYREIMGPETKVLKHGDDFAQYVNQRPSGAWVGFVDFMAELVCLSFCLPPSMVRQMKVGGADSRRDLATMARVCEPWQDLVAGVTQSVYEYVIEAEIEDGSLRGAPDDWRQTSMQFPAVPTVDAGRQAQQDREDVRSGTLTLQEYCGQWGRGYRRHIRQLAREEVEVRQAEADAGLEPGTLSARIYGRELPAAVEINTQKESTL